MKRIIALLLCILLTLGSLPVQVFAEESTAEETTATESTVEATVATEPEETVPETTVEQTEPEETVPETTVAQTEPVEAVPDTTVTEIVVETLPGLAADNASSETVTEKSEPIYGYAYGPTTVVTFEVAVKGTLWVTFAYSDGLSSVWVQTSSGATLAADSFYSGSNNYPEPYVYDQDKFYTLEPGKYSICIQPEKSSAFTVYFLQYVFTYDAHTHNYSTTQTVAPTCSSQGYTLHKCSCGASYKDTYVEKLPHTEATSEEIPATCVATGKTAGTYCSVCNVTLSGRETIPMTDHTFEGAICSYCGYREGWCGSNLQYTLDLDGNLTITGTGTMFGYSQGITPWYDVRESIKSVSLPEGLTRIGDYAFEGLTAVSKITIPKNVTVIREGAFSDCTGLNQLTLPSGITDIGERAFANCTGLTEMEIPEAVTTIGKEAFSGCTGLTNMCISGDAPSIDSDAFQNVTATIHYNSSAIGWEDVVTQSYGGTITWDSATHSYSRESVVAPTCTEQGYSIYRCGCGYVKNDDYVNSLHDTEKICSICGEAGICGETAYWSFDSETGTLTISGSGAASLYPWKSTLGSQIRSVVIEDGINEIGESVFSSLPSLESVVIPASVTDIEKSAFYSSGIKSVHIPETVKYVGPGVFAECKNLTSVVWSSRALINERAFQYCTSLEKIEINENVGTLSEYCFEGCTSLKEITLPDSLSSILKYAFKDCTSLEQLEIPGKGEKIYAGAFLNCRSLKKVTLPSTLTSIGESAFEGCSSLQEIILPDGLTDIGSYAFMNCSSLLSIDIPSGITVLNAYTFSDCSSLVAVNLPSTLVDVHGGVFANCKSLVSLIIPASVDKFLGSLYGCDSLESVYLLADPTCLPLALNESCKIPATGYVIRESPKDLYWDRYPVFDDVIIFTPCSTHTFGSWETYKASGCLTVGVEVSECSGCGIQKHRPVSPKGHTVEIISGTAATCTESGLTDGQECTVCGEVLAEQKTIEALGHTEVIDKAVAATCTATGLTEGKHCSVCKEVLVEQETIEATGHTEVVDKAVDPTCTETGLTEGKHCSACGEVLVVQEVVDALGHTEVVDEAVAPTCTETGLTEGKHCSVCDEVLVKQEVIAKLGHDYKETVVEPTCTETGKTTFTCIRCDDEYFTTATALGHDWSEWDIVDATCTVDGSKTRSCKRNGCDESETQTIPATGEHIYDQEIVDGKYLVSEATSTTLAVYRKSCKCGAAGEEIFTAGELKAPEFKDVPEDAYYYDPVMWAVGKGVTNGYGDADTFAHDIDCTRGQIVTFLWRAAGSPEPASSVMSFDDVGESDFFYKAVLWAVENGITNGYGGADTFAPDITCTRGQVVTMLNRYLGGKATNTENPFDDVKEDAFYYDAVLWAAESGITTGTSATTFEPDATCTRGQIVTFLYRALNQKV